MLIAAAAVVILLGGGAAFIKYSSISTSHPPGENAARPLENLSPTKPSIAVLPFANLSNDADQEYFSDGIIQDIITDLSKFRELAVKVDQTERTLAMNKSTDSLEAYDYYLQAYHHFFQRTRDGHIEARKLFQKAIELDPNYAAAYVGLAKVRTWAVNYGWTEFPNLALQEALDLAKKAVQLDPSLASARAQLGYIYMRFGEYDLAESEPQKAIDLNPNDRTSYRHIGAVLLYAGQPAESLDWYTKVLEFDPYLSPGVYMNIGIGHYLKGDDDQAIHWFTAGGNQMAHFLGLPHSFSVNLRTNRSNGSRRG